MGNSSSKDGRRPERRGPWDASRSLGPGVLSPMDVRAEEGRQRDAGLRPYGREHESTSARASSNNLAFLRIVRGERDVEAEAAPPERPRETKQEREARRVEKERQARLKERERSMREEHVDGGFLVTVGVYVGVEDYNKQIVRQLQIERRLAPFWRGLGDHSESWTEAQLVAAARGLPIPAADEVPVEMARTASQASSPRASEVHVNSLTVPITGRSLSHQSEESALLSASHPAFSPSSGPSSPTNTGASLLRGRAKTLASLATGNKNSADLTPQEVRLPNDPNVNGQPLEAYLYKDATECPICFMHYPPFLNHTRCCDQPICSECFVQIKRPDPHPPEHEQPGQPRLPEEEADLLVSEEAACPFCVTPQFGVTYEPPPFRRGLAYAHQQGGGLRPQASAMSSSTSLQSPAGRRRATSLSANDPAVVTTDRVRPDWAKKLADARANALRRSAAATALHNAAYMLGHQGDASSRSGFARRRRTLFGDSLSASGSGTPQEGSSSDIAGGRTSSRRNRNEDLEELMMMEAIRLSLQAEEERKQREEKHAAKMAKKKAKADKKDEKKAEKAAKKGGRSHSLYQAGTNDSTSSWAGTSSMARSTSNLGAQPTIPEQHTQGKGKQPAQDFAGFNPLTEPTSTLNRSASPPASAERAQQHLEAQRARFESESSPIPAPFKPVHHLREASGVSGVSSTASSFVESGPNSNLSSHNASGTDVSTGGAHLDGTTARSNPGAPAGGEPMLNFRSLTAMIESEHDKASAQHLEHAGPPSRAEEQIKEPSPTGSPRMPPAYLPGAGNRARGDSGESSSSAPPPVYVEPDHEGEKQADDEITPAPQPIAVHDLDRKQLSVQLMDHGHVGETHLH